MFGFGDVLAVLFFVSFLLVSLGLCGSLVVDACMWYQSYKWQRVRRRIEQSHVSEEAKSALLMQVFRLELAEIEGKRKST